MKVLIWKSYGDIRVYDVDTSEKLAKTIEHLISCLSNWGLEEDIEIVRKKIADANGEYKVIARAFQWLVDAINPGYDNDVFEYLELTKLEEAK